MKHTGEQAHKDFMQRNEEPFPAGISSSARTYDQAGSLYFKSRWPPRLGTIVKGQKLDNPESLAWSKSSCRGGCREPVNESELECQV